MDQPPATLALRVLTRVPFDSSNWPSVTTVSPPLSPLPITDWLADRALDLHRLHLGHVVLDHEHEIAGLADLHRGRRHHHRLGSTRNVSSVVTRVPGQSTSSLFGMVARMVTMPVAGSTVFSIIVTWPLACFCVAGNDRLDGGGFRRQRLADLGQNLLRHREADIDRRHLVDGRHRRGVGLAHEIADLDGGRADAAGDRRGDGAIAELDFEIFEQPGVGLDGGAEDVGLGLGVVEIDHRRRALGDQIGVARRRRARRRRAAPCRGRWRPRSARSAPRWRGRRG